MGAEEIEAAFHTADRGLVRVLFHPQLGESLIQGLDGPAQLPARLGQDDDVILKAGEDNAPQFLQAPV